MAIRSLAAKSRVYCLMNPPTSSTVRIWTPPLFDNSSVASPIARRWALPEHSINQLKQSNTKIHRNDDRNRIVSPARLVRPNHNHLSPIDSRHRLRRIRCLPQVPSLFILWNSPLPIHLASRRCAVPFPPRGKFLVPLLLLAPAAPRRGEDRPVSHTRRVSRIQRCPGTRRTTRSASPRS